MSRIIRIARVLCAADSPDREQLLSDYIKMITFDGLREIHPGYIEVLRKRFETMPVPELLQGIEEDKKRMPAEKANWEFGNQMQAKEQAKKKLNLVTAKDEYERTDDIYERVVCSNESPLFEKKRMPAFDGEIVGEDRELKGYFGVHTGGGWLPILIRDNYCNEDYAYFYEIDTAPVYNSKKPFYVMEDFHIMDRTSTPGSWIIFSKYPVIPARLIKLRKVIPVSDVEPAPDLY